MLRSLLCSLLFNYARAAAHFPHFRLTACRTELNLGRGGVGRENSAGDRKEEEEEEEEEEERLFKMPFHVSRGRKKMLLLC